MLPWILYQFFHENGSSRFLEPKFENSLRNSNFRAAARIVNCGFLGARAWAMASVTLLEYLHRCSVCENFIAKKPKCAGLAQEISFSAPNSRSLPWKNVMNWT